MDDDQLKAGLEMYARLLSIQTALVAVIKAIPKNQQLPSLLANEIEQVKTVLLANPMPDDGIAAFENQLELIQKAVAKWHT